MFDSRQIEYILTIADERSLSRAAEKLYLTQSALSQQLAKLKEEGIPPLFKYCHGEMALTNTGKLYVNGARTIMKLKQDAMEHLQNSEQITYAPLQIALSQSIKPVFYEKVLPEFKKEYPNIVLDIKTNSHKNIEKQLIDHYLDIAIFSTIFSTAPNLDYTILVHEELIMIAPKNKDITDLPLVVPDKDTDMYTLCMNVLAQNEISQPIYIYCNDEEEYINLVRDGLCMAVIPKNCFKLKGEFCIVPWRKPFLYYIVAACRNRKELSPPGKKILELLEQNLTETKPESV